MDDIDFLAGYQAKTLAARCDGITNAGQRIREADPKSESEQQPRQHTVFAIKAW